MTLTVKEKEHWKERIGKRIDAAVENLKMFDRKKVLKNIEAAALKEAEESLGLPDLIERFTDVTDRKKQLDERLKAVLTEMREQVGIPENQSHYYGDGLPHWLLEAIKRRAKIHRLPLMEATEIGRKLLMLEREKEELLDTVWLSTSTKQIKQLWAEVAQLLDIEQTDLQKKAAEIEPVAADSK